MQDLKDEGRTVGTNSISQSCILEARSKCSIGGRAFFLTASQEKEKLRSWQVEERFVLQRVNHTLWRFYPQHYG